MSANDWQLVRKRSMVHLNYLIRGIHCHHRPKRRVADALVELSFDQVTLLSHYLTVYTTSERKQREYERELGFFHSWTLLVNFRPKNLSASATSRPCSRSQTRIGYNRSCAFLQICIVKLVLVAAWGGDVFDTPVSCFLVGYFRNLRYLAGEWNRQDPEGELGLIPTFLTRQIGGCTSFFFSLKQASELCVVEPDMP